MDDYPFDLLYRSPPEAESLRQWICELEATQERLGPEFEKVLFDNLSDLYVKD